MLLISVRRLVTAAKMDVAAIKGKFRGCLLGALIGDCTGAPYEGSEVTSGDKIILQRYFDKLEDPDFHAPYKTYTDDTAMTLSVAKFLTDKPEPHYHFLARLFVNEFFRDPRRGYGQNVAEVFHKLRNTKYEDIYKPAKEQFFGGGSYGNGGAMRVAPIALYYYDSPKTMLEVAEKATRLTHTHTVGINGALLQAIAIYTAFKCDPEVKTDPRRFCMELHRRIGLVESYDEEGREHEDMFSGAYQTALRAVEELLQKDYDENYDKEVFLKLGNNISAIASVPTAIFCFLRALNEIPNIQTDNLFRRTIQYAISLGGDTDTIASMAGAIAGAYVGEDGINKCLANQCEFSKEIIEVADNLLAAKGH